MSPGLCEDDHELLDAEREAGKIEQPGLRAGVGKQVEVAVVVGIAPGDRHENADVAYAVPRACPRGSTASRPGGAGTSRRGDPAAAGAMGLD